MNKLYKFDQKIREKYKIILGIDEVGRGCGAGPLIVAGVILKPSFFNFKVKDSKQIKSIDERKELSNTIIENSLFYKVVEFSPEEVDNLGPKKASIEGMNRIANFFIKEFDICLTDYEKIFIESKPQMNIIKGDDTSFSIACASIVAKSHRDEYMQQLSLKYPFFEFTKNQGYLTKRHLEFLKKYGPIKGVHRFSYKPIIDILRKRESFTDE